MRPYAELLANERKQFFRIVMFLFCALQMIALIIYFSHRWSHLGLASHFLVAEYLVVYPAIALYSLKKHPVLSSFHSALTCCSA